MLLAKSRAFEQQMHRLKRNGKRQKMLNEWVKQRGGFYLRSFEERVMQNNCTKDPLDDYIAIDTEMNKPQEQITLEFWLWQMKQEPRRFLRNP